MRRTRKNEYDHLYQTSLYLLLFMGMIVTMVLLMGVFLLASEGFQGISDSHRPRAVLKAEQDSSITKNGETTILQGEEP